MGMGKRARSMVASTMLAATSLMFTAGPALASEGLMGQPTPGAMGLQPAASPLKESAHFFHNVILLPVIVVISLFVLGLLLWVAFRYNAKRNPTPARWSHNTLIEVIWTIVPVVILFIIAIFSFRLLFAYENMPEPDLTVKVTGNQWNWAYEYPDQAVPEYISNMLPESETTPQLYRLAADEPMVVPVGQTVRLLVTAADVIHAVALPAFGIKTDAIPGRVNETWFRADRVGTFYGQCSELCGVDHAFMPIQINVVTQAEFEAWVVSRGGSMPAAADAAAEAAAQEAAAQEAANTAAAEAEAAGAETPAAGPASPETPAAGDEPTPGAAAPTATAPAA